MSTIYITHDHAGGTILDGTSRGDGTNTILKQLGWRWARTLTSWYIPRSRDHDADNATVDRTSAALQAAGFTVEISIDDNARDTTTIEADRAERQDRRVDRLTERATRLTHHAEQAEQAAHQLADRIPFGQPILVDHHSAGPTRRHYERIERTQRKANEIGQAADQAADAAGAAATTTAHRNAPTTVAARIERIAAEIRQNERERDGHTRTYFVRDDGTKEQETFPPAAGAYRDQLTKRITELTEQLAYWQNIRTEQINSGATADYGPHNITAGDQIRIGRRWYRVVRANRKTVTVPSSIGTWTENTPYHRITDHRPVESNA